MNQYNPRFVALRHRQYKRGGCTGSRREVYRKQNLFEVVHAACRAFFGPTCAKTPNPLEIVESGQYLRQFALVGVNSLNCECGPTAQGFNFDFPAARRDNPARSLNR